jgi:hypothetical protein
MKEKFPIEFIFLSYVPDFFEKLAIYDLSM